jgi:hypothetical protein
MEGEFVELIRLNMDARHGGVLMVIQRVGLRYNRAEGTRDGWGDM